jgi:hypothetical protein
MPLEIAEERRPLQVRPPIAYNGEQQPLRRELTGGLFERGTRMADYRYR